MKGRGTVRGSRCKGRGVHGRAGDVRPDGGVEDIDAHDDALHAGGRQAVHGAGAVGQLAWGDIREI